MNHTISCPGCGMTRAWLCALRGQWQSALVYHRLFWAGPPLILLFAHRNAVPAAIRPLWNGGMWMLAALLLAEQLRRCLLQMRQNQMCFDLETEPELIDALIYEYQAIQSRYRYYQRKARAQGLRAIL